MNADRLLTNQSSRGPSGKLLLVVESRRLQDYVDAFESGRFAGLQIASQHFFGADLSFLSDLSAIEELRLSLDAQVSLDILAKLKDLHSLSVGAMNGEYDFSQNPKLENLCFVDDGRKSISRNLPNLRSLSIYGLTGGDFSRIQGGQNAQNLSLSLAGKWPSEVRFDFSNLTSLSFGGSRSVTRLDLQQSHQSLQEVAIDHAPRLNISASLHGLLNLRRLNIESCGEIDTVGWVSSHPNLEHLVIVGTSIRDGSLIEVAALPHLTYFHADSKRHYVPKVAELKAITSLRKGN
jgi:hypothetical protein